MPSINETSGDPPAWLATCTSTVTFADQRPLVEPNTPDTAGGYNGAAATATVPNRKTATAPIITEAGEPTPTTVPIIPETGEPSLTPMPFLLNQGSRYQPDNQKGWLNTAS